MVKNEETPYEYMIKSEKIRGINLDNSDVMIGIITASILYLTFSLDFSVHCLLKPIFFTAVLSMLLSFWSARVSFFHKENFVGLTSVLGWLITFFNLMSTIFITTMFILVLIYIGEK